MNNGMVKKVAYYSMLTALCVILGYVESLFPVFIMVPGVKLGLTNIAVIVALYMLGNEAALVINFVRIVLSSLLLGMGSAFIYSLFGGMLSVLMMILLKKTGFKRVTVSILGGLSHNTGQIAAAMLLLKTSSLWGYLVYLWFFGLLSGFIIGVVGSLLLDGLKNHHIDRNNNL